MREYKAAFSCLQLKILVLKQRCETNNFCVNAVFPHSMAVFLQAMKMKIGCFLNVSLDVILNVDLFAFV